MYDATSGWVHFSPEVMHAALELHERTEKDDDLSLSLGFGVPIRRERIPLSALEELVGAMTQATEELFGYIEHWESRKGLPMGQARDLGAQ